MFGLPRISPSKYAGGDDGDAAIWRACFPSFLNPRKALTRAFLPKKESGGEHAVGAHNRTKVSASLRLTTYSFGASLSNNSVAAVTAATVSLAVELCNGPLSNNRMRSRSASFESRAKRGAF